MSEQPIRNFSIRDAQLSDLETLAIFNAAVAEESVGRRLDPEVARRGVHAVLMDPQKGHYLIAVDHAGSAVGQTLLTREWSDWSATWFVWIQSVYVVPRARRTGVFRALLGAANDLARRDGAEWLRLYVDRQNHLAEATYEALGFRPATERIFELRTFASPGKLE